MGVYAVQLSTRGCLCSFEYDRVAPQLWIRARWGLSVSLWLIEVSWGLGDKVRWVWVPFFPICADAELYAPVIVLSKAPEGGDAVIQPDERLILEGRFNV